MTQVLYAIADCEPEAIAARGPSGSELHAVGSRPIAVLGEASGSRREQLRAHDLTVAALMAEHTVLPARFGTPAREDELSELLESRAAALGQALARVRGAVELSVVAHLRSPDAPAATGPGSGSEYLAGRLALRQSARQTEALLGPLAALAREHAHSRAAERHGCVRCAYLVDADSVEAFVRRVRELDARSAEVELICTGPWAPYSFTGAWL